MNSSDVSMPVAKAASAITVAAAAKADVVETVAQAAVQNAPYSVWHWVMSVQWSTVASIFAAVYTFTLISEWWWKKLWGPLAERRGWIKPKKRRVLTESEWAQLQDDDEK